MLYRKKKDEYFCQTEEWEGDTEVAVSETFEILVVTSDIRGDLAGGTRQCC